MNAYVVLQTLDVEDVVKTDTKQFVVALDKHETVFTIGILFLSDTEPFERLVAGFQEVLVGDGLQQIVECTDLIAFDGILREGSGEDDLRVLGQDLGKFYAESSGIWMSRKSNCAGLSRRSFMAVMALL